MSDYVIAASIISGGAIIVAAIIKFSKSNGYMTRREFTLWHEGFDKQWADLKSWIEEVQKDVKELLKKVG